MVFNIPTTTVFNAWIKAVVAYYIRLSVIIIFAIEFAGVVKRCRGMSEERANTETMRNYSRPSNEP